MENIIPAIHPHLSITLIALPLFWAWLPFVCAAQKGDFARHGGLHALVDLPVAQWQAGLLAQRGMALAVLSKRCLR